MTSAPTPIAACALAVAVLLAWPIRASPWRARRSVAPSDSPSDSTLDPTPDPGALRRYRLLLSALAAAAGQVFVGGVAGWVAAGVCAVVVWVVIGRSEPTGVRRRREAIQRDLPHLVLLLAATLRGGASPVEAVLVVAAALPGPAADRLARAGSQLTLGADPVAVWSALADEPALTPLGRVLARAEETGAPITTAMDRLVEELARSARADVEERARAVGVKAAVPLGLCLLPAFVLIGIVPLVVGLMSTVVW